MADQRIIEPPVKVGNIALSVVGQEFEKLVGKQEIAVAVAVDIVVAVAREVVDGRVAFLLIAGDRAEARRLADLTDFFHTGGVEVKIKGRYRLDAVVRFDQLEPVIEVAFITAGEFLAVFFVDIDPKKILG